LVLGGKEATGTPSTVYQLNDGDVAWSKAPSLEQGRLNGGVVRGQYGVNILLFGGVVGGHASAGAFNYSPMPDGESADAPSMNVARSSFAYTADPVSGDIYAIGGLGSTNAPIASAERFDPATNSWEGIAPLPQAVYGATAASDGFGHLFVIGGLHTAGGAPLTSVYRYTVATDSWDQVASLSVGLHDASAVAGPDGMIYVVGGVSAAGTVSSVESYNPAINTWGNEASLASPVYGAAVTVDANNELNVIGGFNQAGVPVSTVSLMAIVPGVLTPYTPAITVQDNWYTFDGQPHFVTASVVGTDGVMPVDGTLSFTYDGSSDLPTAAGDYKVIATFTSNDANYVSTVAAGDLFIAQATPVVTLTGGGTFRYDGQPHAATATEAGINGATVNGSLTVTYNGMTSPPVTAGIYNVLATFTSADSNYSDASASTTITIPDPTIPTGVTAVGASTTSIKLTWDAAPIPVAGYNVYERHVLHDPKGSGSTITYPLVVANVQGTSVTIGVGTATAASGGHTYYVSSVSPDGVISARSAPASGQALYAPSLYGALLGGAVVSSANVQEGQSVQVTLLAYGNEKPTFSLVSGPGTMSVDAASGVVTYSPAVGEAGDVPATFKATNRVGSATETFVFHVMPAPSVAGVSVNVGGAPVSLVTDADGVRLLPAGRVTDLPWAGINSVAVTLSSAAPLLAGDVSVLGSSGIDYGPVTVSGSGENYTITFARAINSADRVTIRIGNSAITPIVRRLDVLPGDLSDDGAVGFADLVAIAQHYGTPGGAAEGDLTNDGMVDFADLVGVAQYYGESLPALGPVGAAAVVAPVKSAGSSQSLLKGKTTFSTQRVKVTQPPRPKARIDRRR